MAGGKLTPRQKMINMMYLVLTALLALNISKDILLALEKIDKGYAETIATVEKSNATVYQSFDAAASENPAKAKEWRDKAYDVKKQADALYNLIETQRNEITEMAGGRDEEGKLKRGDNLEVAANYMLNPENVGGKDGAKKLKASLQSYKNSLIEMAGDNQALVEQINATLDLSDQKVGKDGTTHDWEHATFEHFPLIAILTFMSDLQADVRNMEASTLKHLQQAIDAGTVKFNAVKAMVFPKSNYVTQGGEYEAEVFLAAYDDTQEPTILVNGEALPIEQINNGKGKVSFKANSVGEQKWSGVIKIKQTDGEKEYPFEAAYTVAPQSVVISPTKMNVLYRGVENPLEIGVPGVDPSKIMVSGPGVSGSNGKYMARVDKIKGKTIKISVSVKEEDGTTRAAGTKEFRLKGLPMATTTMFTKTGGTISKSLASKGKIDASFEDFPFDLKLKVTAFEVKLDGQPPMKVRGNVMDGNVRKYIQAAKPGSSITIRNVKAVSPNGYKVNKVAPVSFDLN